MAKSSQSWKRLERNVAKFFNTERRLRGADFSQNDVEIIVDVQNWIPYEKPAYIIGECKYRSNAMGIVDNFVTDRSKEKISIGLIGDSIIMTSLDDFKEVFLAMTRGEDLTKENTDYYTFRVKKTVPKYVNEYITQASEYSETLVKTNSLLHDGIIPCLPLLCVSKRGRQGIFALFRIEDFRPFL